MAVPFAESINIYDQAMASTVSSYISKTTELFTMKRWGCLATKATPEHGH